MPLDQLAQIFAALRSGVEVAAGNVIQFPTDVAVEVGGLGGEGISTVVQMGNGAAAEVSQLTTTTGGVTTTTGMGLLAVDVGLAGAAIAPALGLAAGVSLYNLSPEFWTDVSNQLMDAGQTVGRKVRAFLDGTSETAGFSEATIEIFKNAFMEAGLFETVTALDIEDVSALNTYYNTPMGVNPSGKFFMDTSATSVAYPYFYVNSAGSNVMSCAIAAVNSSGKINDVIFIFASLAPFQIGWAAKSEPGQFPTPDTSANTYSLHDQSFFGAFVSTGVAAGGISITDIVSSAFINVAIQTGSVSNTIAELMYQLLFGDITIDGLIQPGAIVPDANPFPATYPNWIPSTVDGINIYPTELPVNDPYPDQDAAQNPSPDVVPAPWLEWLLDNLPIPIPLDDAIPLPIPIPDEDEQAIAEPIVDEDEIPEEPNPPDPNPDPDIPPLPVVPDIPTMVDSNAMFTVYSPSLSDLNAFGGWLWSSNILEQILRMWQNPLDGIIAFMKVYAAPSVTTARTIQIGYLASNATAPVVSSQFVSIDCGTIQVKEKKRNATDYSPYVSLHLYLPFIGIVELDPDEFMDGSISVKYTVDMYTGTCLAEVSATRTTDMPNETILYTFSGNASQQLPLTSASFNGALGALVSIIGARIGVGTGGAIAKLAGATSVGHSLTHEMIHVGHSSGLSANAGIMGSRKPYLIISRRHGYDANNYGQQYGYPGNKTVYLNNCRGYTRVKSCHFKGDATDVEKQEIINYLSNGVIL